MVVGNLKVLAMAARRHPQARSALSRWLEIAESAVWNSIHDARQSFPTADFVKGTPYTAFNIAGNGFRLIAVVAYALGQIQLVEVLTHAEYSKKY